MRNWKKTLGSIALALCLVAVPLHAAYEASVTIANGAALSGAADLTAYVQRGNPRVVGLEMPAAWTTANITLQTSSDGNTYYNVWSAGSEYTLTNTAASQLVVIPPSDLLGANYLKVRSGTAGSPVNQGAARMIKLLLQPLN